MRTALTVRERLRIAKGRLREYQGRLRKLEGQFTILRGRAAQARGRTRLRLLPVERRIRGTLTMTVTRIEALRRGIEAGIKAGASAYRRTRSK